MEGSGDVGERGEGPRPPIELKVEYQKLNTFFADYTRNICKGGTFIRTRRPLGEGTEFVFKLIVPRLEEPLAIRGAVRWVVREGQPPPPEAPAGAEPGMGIRFLYDSEGERRTIESIVERLMIDSLGQLIYSKLMGRARAPSSDDAGGSVR
jgi:type IV pilus assembly protein PilZ